MDDGTVREEYAEDIPFVGCRRDRPLPSFRVSRDVYAGYFLRCDRQMVICAHSGLLVQSATRTRTLVTAIRFRFSIGDPIPFSTLMQTRM
jgi:hypothetical protein